MTGLAAPLAAQTRVPAELKPELSQPSVRAAASQSLRVVGSHPLVWNAILQYRSLAPAPSAP